MKREPIKTLIIEDEEQYASYLNRLLNDAPCFEYESHIAHTWADACKALTENQYDLLLLDLKLPDAEGTSLIRETRKMSPFSCNIVVTSLYREEMGESVRNYADEFIPKDTYHGVEMLHTIRNAVVTKREQMKIASSPSPALTAAKALVQQLKDDPNWPTESDPLGIKLIPTNSKTP